MHLGIVGYHPTLQHDLPECKSGLDTIIHHTKTYAIDLPDFEGLVRDQGNAVVKVTVSATETPDSSAGNLPNFNDEELPEFFRRFCRLRFRLCAH